MDIIKQDSTVCSDNAIPVKRAVLVGINDYFGHKSLRGAVNDVFKVKSVLNKHGFQDSNITTLIGHEATKEAILNSLVTSAKVTESQDVFVFHFSGHGAQIKNSRKHNGTNEALVPIDEQYILDDQLECILRKFKSRNLTIIIDACHSGDINRELTVDQKQSEAHVSVRSIGRVEVDLSTIDLAQMGDIKTRSEWIDGLNYTLIASCLDIQQSGETSFNGTHYGVLTHYLCSELELLAPEQAATTTWRDIFSRMVPKYKGAGLREEPQLEGLCDWVVFGEHAIVPVRHIAVSVSGDSIRLLGGLLHGVENGSIWNVYSADAKTSNAQQLVASLQVIDVEVTSSEACLNEASVAAGCTPNSLAFAKATCTTSHSQAVSIVVANSDEAHVIQVCKELCQLLSDCYYLTVRPYKQVPLLLAAKYDYLVAMTAGGIRLLKSELMQHVTLSCPLGDYRAFAVNLKKLAYAHFALNKLPRSVSNSTVLQQQIQIQTFLYNLRNSHTELDRSTSDDNVSVYEGQWGHFEVSSMSDSTESLYITVLSFDADCSITVFYPLPGAHNIANRLGCGKSVLIGAKRDSAGRLSYLSQFSIASNSQLELNGDAVHTFRFIITSKPVDFTSLTQNGVCAWKDFEEFDNTWRAFNTFSLNSVSECFIKDITIRIMQVSRRSVLNSAILHHPSWLGCYTPAHWSSLQQALLRQGVFRTAATSSGVKEVFAQPPRTVEVNDWTAVIFVHGSILDETETWKSEDGSDLIKLVAQMQFLSHVRLFQFQHGAHNGRMDEEDVTTTLVGAIASLEPPSIAFVAHEAGALIVIRTLLKHAHLQDLTKLVIFSGTHWLRPLTRCVDVLVSSFVWAQSGVGSELQSQRDFIRNQLPQWLERASQKMLLYAIVRSVGSAALRTISDETALFEAVQQKYASCKAADEAQLVYACLSKVVDPLTSSLSTQLNQCTLNRPSAPAEANLVNAQDSRREDLELAIFSLILTRNFQRIVELTDSEEAQKAENANIWYYRALAQVNLDRPREAIQSFAQAFVCHREYNMDITETLEQQMRLLLVGRRKRLDVQQLMTVLRALRDSDTSKLDNEADTFANVLYSLYLFKPDDPEQFLTLKAVAWLHYGGLVGNLGQPEGAVGCYLLAAALAYNSMPQTNDAEMANTESKRAKLQFMCKCLRSLARGLTSAGYLDMAERFISEGLRYAIVLNDLLLVAKFFNCIAVIKINQGRFFDAVELLLQAKEDAEAAQDKELLVESLSNIAVCERYSGNVLKAIETLQKAHEISKSLGRDLQMTVLDRMLPCYNELQDRQSASRCCKEMKQLLESSHVQFRQAFIEVAQLIDQGEQLLQNNDASYKTCFQNAVELLQSLISDAVLHQSPSMQLECLMKLHVLHCALDDTSADATYEQAMRVATQMKDVENVAFLKYNRARFDCYRGKFDDALQLLLSADPIYSQVASKARHQHVVSFRESRGPALLNGLMQLAAIGAGKNLLALEVADQGRSHALLQHLASMQEMTYVQMQQLAATLGVTIVLYSMVGESRLKGKQILCWLISPLERSSPSFHLLETDQQPFGFYIDPTDVSRALTTMRILEEQPDHVQSLKRYYNILWKPLLPWLTHSLGRTVIVVPQGSLYQVPYASMMDDRGHFVVDDYAVAIAPSISFLQAALRDCKATSNSQLTACIVGNPATDQEYLRYAEEEANTIAHMLGTTPLLRDRATKAAVVERIKTAQIIHFACHGSASMRQGDAMPGCLSFAEKPDSSCTKLKVSSRNDNILYADEISSMDLSNVRLAFLSACDTGRGEINSQGLLGLGRAFLMAKVKSVIVSLWPVRDDPVMIELVKTFYSQYQAGQGPAAALRAAMINAKTIVPVTHWGSFSLLGLP